MKQLITRLDQLLEYLIISIMAVLVIDVLWQVASRFILGDPSSFTDELARFLLIWLSLFGGAYMLGKKMHLAIDLISHKLDERKALRYDNFIQITILVFAIAVLLIGGSRLVFVTLFLNQTSAALGVPLGYVYMVLPLSGVIMCIYCIHFILENLATSRSLNSNAQNSGE